MTGPPCLLELSGLRVDRGAVQVLDVPSFRVDDGEFVSLVGPNGSGKSSLLLAMMCLLPRVTGEVRYRGKAVRSDREAIEYRRKVAMVFQEPLLFDETVYDNVASGLRIRGVDGKEIRPRVMEYLDHFELTGMATRSARKLSGGEARRVNLARALVVEPELVLLDEPFANLDLPARRSIIGELERTLRDAGTAAILVTHDQSEALRLSDRMVVMSGGRIVQSDTPSAVMTHPIVPFVASWVGIETSLEATAIHVFGDVGASRMRPS
jgi:tungstate transport system ATP-binding protein